MGDTMGGGVPMPRNPHTIECKSSYINNGTIKHSGCEVNVLQMMSKHF